MLARKRFGAKQYKSIILILTVIRAFATAADFSAFDSQLAQKMIVDWAKCGKKRRLDAVGESAFYVSNNLI
jgi:hypothetical protein